VKGSTSKLEKKHKMISNLFSRYSSKKDSKTVASEEKKKKTSKPRRPPAEDDDDDDDRRRDKPPSRAHLTDEELVRDWYVLYFFFSRQLCYPLNSLNRPYLTRKQVEEYKTMFDDLDIEADGKITAEDIQERLRQVGSFKTIKQIKKNLKRYDTDGSGALDFCEFLTLMLHDLNLSNPQETLRNVFLTFDEDGDGKITAAELKRTMETVGIPLSLREAKFVIEMADREGDKELCYDEFVDFVLGNEYVHSSGAEEEAGDASKESAGVEYFAPMSLTTRLGSFFRSGQTGTQADASGERGRRGGDSDEETENAVLSDEENVVLS
jgi:calmodulin